MTNPDTKNGITKDSTLQINVNPYLPNNYKQTLNYVGYWKWDSTNQQFIQVLNNQDIIDEKYNIKIQPLFYDADTGLPQKVTINSGNTKRLKMVNDNNDGSMEPAEYIENNTMVKFNSKTRSVTEYPYFEVESIPPTISSPITSNGYYKFDGNTLIPGTNQDYNLYIEIESTVPEYDVTKFLFTYLHSQPSTYYYNFNATASSVKKATSSTGDCCYIVQFGDTIVLNFGKPPVGAYYTTTSSVTSLSGNYSTNGKFVKYDGTIIMNEYIYYYYDKDYVTFEKPYNLSIFGKLINTPN